MTLNPLNYGRGLLCGVLLCITLGSCSSVASQCAGFPTKYVSLRRQAPAISREKLSLDVTSISQAINSCRPDDPYVSKTFHLLYLGNYKELDNQYLLYDIEESSDIVVSYKIDQRGKVIGAYIFDRM